MAADAAGRAKQARFLAGRGFGSDVIRQLVRGLDAEDRCRPGFEAAQFRVSFAAKLHATLRGCLVGNPAAAHPEPMPLPPPSAARRLKHHRQIDVQVFASDDGLWEAEARLSDVKSHDSALATGIRPAGEPIHDLLLRIVVDLQLNVVASGAESLSVPYPGHCDRHGDAYGQLAGLNLMRGFRQALDANVSAATSRLQARHRAGRKCCPRPRCRPWPAR